MQGQIEITFDRSERLYKWIDPTSGEVLTAPAKEKEMLFRAAVGILDPDLYKAAEAAIERHPQLERVTWRAVELVAREKIEVYPGLRGSVAAMVDSSDEYGRYAIEHTKYGLTCQCEHFQGGYAPLTESGSRCCKHIVAYHLWLHTRAEW